MDKTELVNLVSSKAGLSQDQATQAVDTVLDFIKQKLTAGACDSIRCSLIWSSWRRPGRNPGCGAGFVWKKGTVILGTTFKKARTHRRAFLLRGRS
jgi:nucleoid DNA-binding protein